MGIKSKILAKVFGNNDGRKKTVQTTAGVKPASNSPLTAVIKSKLTEVKAVKPKIIDADLEEARQWIKDTDAGKIWAFFSGQQSQDFRGNPKYLFAYINNYRSDIKAYWFCSDPDTISLIRSLGFHAFDESSSVAQYLFAHTGVVVAEQVKYALPDALKNSKYLNLWHGVGFKRVERRLFQGDIAMPLARKYVKIGSYYRTHEIVLSSNPEMEHDLILDLGVPEERFIRAGYPRCLYQNNFTPVKTFEHDIRKIKGLGDDSRLVVYAPTYRAKLEGTVTRAIPDFDRLYDFCREHNYLFIFKMHPNMENDSTFLQAKEKYADCPYFWFWDNADDFYEIMDQVDLAIVDYSAILSDMIAMGIRKYIRYIFDYEEYAETVDIHDYYFANSTGVICRTFDELLQEMDCFEERDYTEELHDLSNRLWQYSGGAGDFEKIINTALEMPVPDVPEKTLYSFDVFDTLITRKTLLPVGIFYYVQGKAAKDPLFSPAFVSHYISVRKFCESNVREYYQKTFELRNSDTNEIQFDEIFERMQSVYHLSDEQISKLKEWELEAELDNVIPIRENIELLKRTIAQGQKAIMISDMYLPESFIRQMLMKADPDLRDVPLFLSSSYGYKKTNQKLFYEVYKSFEPYYDFDKWVHYGDNVNADQTQPRRFEINTRKLPEAQFDSFQSDLAAYMNNYDGYLVAAMQQRLLNSTFGLKDRFVLNFVALCFVPYIDWVLRDAEERGYKILYFVSRDGHHLKRIADRIIEIRKLEIKTKYIYGSRRVWRIPSYIDHIDQGFWGGYGNFDGVVSKEKLLSALSMDEAHFKEIFPLIDLDNVDFTDKKRVSAMIDSFSISKKYEEYLLAVAKEKRTDVIDYLLQEIDPKEEFAVVEYWGRGYNQDCMLRLWRTALNDQQAVMPYYYCRSVLPTDGGSLRYNFTANDSKQNYIEAIFANMPYHSIEDYRRNEEGRPEPVIEPIEYDEELFRAMTEYLPVFAEAYAQLGLQDPIETDRMLYDFMVNYYTQNLTNPDFAETLGSLVDSAPLYGNKRDYAPAYTMENLQNFKDKVFVRGSSLITNSISMSYTRSAPEVQEEYCRMYQILPGDNVAGGRLLNEADMIKSDEYKSRYYQLMDISGALANKYESCVAAGAIPENYVFVSNKDKFDHKVLQECMDALRTKTSAQILSIALGAVEDEMSIHSAAETLAAAKYIIMLEPIEKFSQLKFRNETTVLQLQENAFSLYMKGRLTQTTLNWKNKYTQTASANRFSAIQVPASDLGEWYVRQFSQVSNTRTDLEGCISTDVYFDQDHKAECLNRLNELFPEKGERKVILYMPAPRKSGKSPEWAKIFDFDLLNKLLGDEYVLVFHCRKKDWKKYKNVSPVKGFAKVLQSKDISLRDAMIAADVIVGDYRDAFFEAPLLQKPCFSTAFDYETYINRDPNLRCLDFTDLLFCPIVDNEHQLKDWLSKLDEYDYTSMIDFRERMLSGCDGHSLEKTIQYIL